MPIRATVLLVEDEVSAREALTLFLQLDDHNVIAVGSGKEALETLSAMAPPPDVLVTDYQLGGDVTGADLVEQVRAALGHEVPAVVLSGDATRAARRCASIPNCQLFQKPIDAEELARHVREATLRAADPAP